MSATLAVTREEGLVFPRGRALQGRGHAARLARPPPPTTPHLERAVSQGTGIRTPTTGQLAVHHQHHVSTGSPTLVTPKVTSLTLLRPGLSGRSRNLGGDEGLLSRGQVPSLRTEARPSAGPGQQGAWAHRRTLTLLAPVSLHRQPPPAWLPSPSATHLHSLLLLSPLFLQQAALLLGQDFDEAFAPPWSPPQAPPRGRTHSSR